MINIGSFNFKYPNTKTNLAATLPLFYNDLRFVNNPELIDKLMLGIATAVLKAEEKFDQEFGGWYPKSNQFGVGTLRPQHVDHPTATNNRWLWTSGGSTTVHSLADSFISATLASNELIFVYGFFNLEAVPNTIEIQPVLGANTLPVIQLQPIRAKQDQYIIFPEHWIIEPYSTLTVNASCISTSTAEEMGLMGYIFAPNSVLITA